MKWWKFSVFLILASVGGAVGCGSSKSSGVAITWSLTCASGVTANTCGSIDASGLYTAPATIPTVPASTSSGTPTPAPTVTIKGTAQADTSKTATAALTIVTGISIAITPTSATVGTKETFPFTATVTNPGCNTTSNPTCNNVTWSAPTSTTTPNPNGSINSTTGVYT